MNDEEIEYRIKTLERSVEDIRTVIDRLVGIIEKRFGA